MTLRRVYKAPDEVGEYPREVGHWKDWLEVDKKYVKKLKDWAIENGKGSYAGRIVRFPSMDGYARYVIFSLKPVILILIDDGYQCDYVEGLTAGYIKEEADKQSHFEKMFGGTDEH